MGVTKTASFFFLTFYCLKLEHLANYLSQRWNFLYKTFPKYVPTSFPFRIMYKETLVNILKEGMVVSFSKVACK